MLGENGGDDFYTGELADLIAADLKDLGSIITKEDLESYKLVWTFMRNARAQVNKCFLYFFRLKSTLGRVVITAN